MKLKVIVCRTRVKNFNMYMIETVPEQEGEESFIMLRSAKRNEALHFILGMLVYRGAVSSEITPAEFFYCQTKLVTEFGGLRQMIQDPDTKDRYFYVEV